QLDEAEGELVLLEIIHGQRRRGDQGDGQREKRSGAMRETGNADDGKNGMREEPGHTSSFLHWIRGIGCKRPDGPEAVAQDRRGCGILSAMNHRKPRAISRDAVFGKIPARSVDGLRDQGVKCTGLSGFCEPPFSNSTQCVQWKWS